MRLNPDTGKPDANVPEQRGYGLHWRRRQGRARLLKEDPIPLHRDEMLSRQACVAGLRKICGTLEKGGKRPLARLLGMTLEQLRSLMRGRGGIPETIRRRISSFLMKYARGEIECVRLSPHAKPQALWRAHKPSHQWRKTITTYDREVAQQWINDVERNASDVVFHSCIPRALVA